MVVGIDGRSLAGGRAARGIAHYTASLVAALRAGFPEDEWRLGGRAGRAPYAAAALLGRPRLDRLLGGGLDVLWAPAPAPLAFSSGLPFVLTVHDLSFVERPRDYTAYERLWHRLGRPRALARRAARLIAVSQATRDVLLGYWDLDPARVVVVPSGVTRPSGPPAPPPAGLPERYLLFVGALEPRKGPDVLARAFARARAEGLEAELVVVGEGRLAGAVDGPGVRRLGAVAERAELESLYAGALALVMPSWAEGFGWPPLEAAACGTPSVVSDLPATRETLGDAALRVPPGDENALAAALLRVASDEDLRTALATGAAAAVEERTWEAAARATHEVLEEARAA
jgi:glycosyltransferase involved in cell wall biosynthesis